MSKLNTSPLTGEQLPQPLQDSRESGATPSHFPDKKGVGPRAFVAFQGPTAKLARPLGPLPIGREQAVPRETLTAPLLTTARASGPPEATAASQNRGAIEHRRGRVLAHTPGPQRPSPSLLPSTHLSVPVCSQMNPLSLSGEKRAVSTGLCPSLPQTSSTSPGPPGLSAHRCLLGPAVGWGLKGLLLSFSSF